MVKILQVLGTLNCGGAETIVVNWLRVLDRSEFHFDFLVYGSEKGYYEEVVESLGAHVIHIPEPSLNYLAFYRNVFKIMQAKKYDAVHVHTLYNGGFALRAAKKCGIKVRISHSHTTQNRETEATNPILQIYERIMKSWILKYSTHYVACGLQAGNFLYGDTFFSAKGTVLYNGIVPELFHYDPRIRDEQRKTLQIGSDDLVIGHVGRFTKVKNHSFLIDILASLIEIRPNCKLLLIGDGPLRRKIEEKSKELGVRDKVIFTGVCSNIVPYLHTMDVVVFPSLFEGIPMALIEAQSNGLPCLISDTISNEIKILKSSELISLNKGAQYWRDTLLRLANCDRNSEAVELVADSPFNLYNSIEELKSIYRESISEVCK